MSTNTATRAPATPAIRAGALRRLASITEDLGTCPTRAISLVRDAADRVEPVSAMSPEDREVEANAYHASICQAGGRGLVADSVRKILLGR